MFFIVISFLLIISVDVNAAENKKYNGWFSDYLNHTEEIVEKTILHNDRAQERIDQVNDHVKEIKDEAFDRVELLQVMVREDVDEIRHNAIVDLTQNMTKMMIASSLGIGAVIGLYQATKAAINIAYAKDEPSDKKEYVTMFSGAGVAAVCAACSLLCYWSIN